MLVITRHLVPQTELKAWLELAKSAIAPLANSAGCQSVSIALATDQADLVAIVSRWDGVGAYRRALSSYEVKLNSIPFLSTAIDEPSAFETVYENLAGSETLTAPARAFDADEVGLGHAAEMSVRHRAE